MKITENNVSAVLFTAVNKNLLAAGRYIFTVAPIDGLPVGVSLNDLCQYTGTVWELLLKYNTINPTIQGGSPLKTYIKNESNSWVIASKKTPKIINSSSVFADDSIGEKETFDLSNFVKASISTGLISGAQLVSTGATFSVTAGSGLIINNETIEGTPSITAVTIPFTNNNAIISGVSVNYILINSAGAVVVLSTKPTAAQRRTNIYLGRFNLNNAKNSILTVINDKQIQYSPSKQMHDYIGAAYRNVGRVTTRPNGTNMFLNLIGGEIIGTGVGYSNNINAPNSLIVPNQTGFSFRMATQTAIIDTTVAALPNAANFDSNGTITANGGANGTAINHRVYIQANGSIVVQYGQQVYNSLATATAGIATESFVINPINAIGNALLIGFITVVRNATNLNNAGQATFTAATPYGDASAGVGGGTAYVGINGINVAGANIDGSLLATKIPNSTFVNNLPNGGSIGLASATVDIFDWINIDQSTAGQTVSIPFPSNFLNEKIIYIANSGFTSFIILGISLQPNSFLILKFDTSLGWLISGGTAAVVSQPLYSTTSAPLASAIANSVTTLSNIKVRYNTNGTNGNLEIACVTGNLNCQLITARQNFNGGVTVFSYANQTLTTTFTTYDGGGLSGPAELIDYEIIVSNNELYEVKLRLTGSSGTDLVLINLKRIY